MLVLDASAAVDFLLLTARGLRVYARLFRTDERLAAPHMIDLEVIQALRRMLRSGVLTSARAQEALDDFRDLPIERFAHSSFVPEIWRLRDSISAYDAAYVALADAYSAVLITCDARLAGATGHSAKIELIS